MGCISSRPPVPSSDPRSADDSRQVDKYIAKERAREQAIIKLLLLGTGESGKSTIFKQMQILYQNGFTDLELQTFTTVIRRNVVEAMQVLLHGIIRLRLYISPQAQQAGQFLLSLDPLAADFWVDDIVVCIQILWNASETGVVQAFKLRSKLQILDSAQYLFDNIQRIGAWDYKPTQQDILRARLRTSGIVEKMMNVNGVDFKFIDVGGQRNERRKWIHCFQDVTAVIFVSAISEYDQMLYEDERENRLIESMRVFDSVCNNKYFRQTAIILFMNKIDLFEQKIRNVSIRTCFPEYQGPDTATEASQYIRDRFLALNKVPGKLIFSHITCATDTGNIQRVFQACQVVILDQNINEIGIS